MADKIILLAEDSQDDEVLFKRVLAKVGVLNPLHVVHDGAEALAYLKGEEPFSNRQKYPLPDVLVLDIRMPKMNGFELLAWVEGQPHLNRLLRIVLTQLDHIKDIEWAYQLGADTFLIKPLESAELVNLVTFFKGYWTVPVPSARTGLSQEAQAEQ
jgi:CheY-like chemotaxis protein